MQYGKAIEEYKTLLSTKQYKAAKVAKAHLKKTVDRINTILALLDEENDQEKVKGLKAERTRLMRKAEGYLKEL